MTQIVQRLHLLIRLLTNGSLLWLAQFYVRRAEFFLSALRLGVRENHSALAEHYQFRRNIHRLEKGLSFPAPKSVFAEGYIVETVQSYASMRTTHHADTPTLDWGEAVLNNYFEKVSHTETVERAYAHFRSLTPRLVHPNWYPYQEQKRPELSVDFASLQQLATRRRSVRTYLGRKIEPEVVAKAMEIARLSPSACNRQPFRFYFCNKHDSVDQIAQVPGGVKGYSVPSIVVVIGQYRAYFDERDFVAPIIDASMASMSLILALETLGLSSVCINWPNLPDRERKIRQLIHLDADEFVIMMIGIGYADPAGIIPYSAKRSIDELLTLDRDRTDQAMVAHDH